VPLLALQPIVDLVGALAEEEEPSAEAEASTEPAAEEEPAAVEASATPE
jgi:hypothetical protein